MTNQKPIDTGEFVPDREAAEAAQIDLSGCEVSCCDGLGYSGCPVQGHLAGQRIGHALGVRDEGERLLGWLKRLEWSGTVRSDQDNIYDGCPCCRFPHPRYGLTPKDEPHLLTCDLAAEIERIQSRRKA